MVAEENFIQFVKNFSSSYPEMESTTLELTLVKPLGSYVVCKFVTFRVLDPPHKEIKQKDGP